jgi:1-acyl-sn-glycerol-3-phosphate acyltransferase
VRSWLEAVGVTIAAGLWLVGQRRNARAHFALQRWWAAQLMNALQLTTGIRVDAADATSLSPGPAIMLCRHASLADSLLSAWVVTSKARMNPRYVLKKELLADPCLDVVGNRLPNYFLDRQAPDSATEPPHCASSPPAHGRPGCRHLPRRHTLVATEASASAAEDPRARSRPS